MVSKQSRKQRKALFTAPLHKRRKFLSSKLSKEVKEKFQTKKRAIPLKKGDKVKVMKGERKGHIGKVVRTDVKKRKVYVEGIVDKKVKGEEVLSPIDPSNLLLIEPDMSDKRRKNIVYR